LVRFGFRIGRISATENSNQFQKTRFWKEKSVEDVVLFELMSTKMTLETPIISTQFESFLV
jgi:hypothetical protein